MLAVAATMTPWACSSVSDNGGWDETSVDTVENPGASDGAELGVSESPAEFDEPSDESGATELEAALGSMSAALKDDAVYLHRAFHPDTSEHFYTADVSEASRAGFIIEAINYFGLDLFGSRTRVPFFRCFLFDVGMHLYTTSPSCEGANARNEGIIGYIATQQDSDTIPLFRLFNPGTGDHFYTTSSDERLIALVARGYVNEGTSGFVYPP
jgi:hypothetical protein